MRPVLLIVITSLLLCAATFIKGEDVLVTIEQGTLQGTVLTSVYNTSYTAFLGIPYAEPPVGDLRFQPPLAASGWDGVRDATQYGSDCVQATGSGSEDCLYLNVYVPGLPEEDAGLPVIVWVHGGAFVNGSGSNVTSGPDFLVSYGVILVTINYRLGPLGFLSTGDSAAPGNAGLKDQRLALVWVQSNIASFGGDPQRVTLQGQSAGAGAASLHLVASPGLFSQAIIESGTFASSMTIERNPRYHAFKLGAVLGFETEDSQQLVDFLRSVNATDLLVDKSLLSTDEEKLYISFLIWAPTIEPQVNGSLLSESPITALKEGRFSHVPIMIGGTSAENGINILSRPDVISNLNEVFEEVVGPCLHLPTSMQQAEAALKLREFYFGNNTISLDDPEPLVHLTQDVSFFDATDAVVRTIVETADIPVYYYEFDYRGDSIPTNEWGVNHGGELRLLFLRNDTKYNLDLTSEEDEVRRTLLRLWTNFAKYGNPTPEGDPVTWEPYNPRNRSYLLMRANFSLEENFLGERMDFWNTNIPLMPYPGTY
ncbi:juvenile hormone esterase-like [Schistocerca cancellata]|uniref:juvenile hormone esterase-like n=1 Tax=Schistocerca cancellata TaxID=274614 RepID=UPI0021192CD2|nr:juvenile hormone esterase-like [Schistocerca cancellata]